jgi:hypothetical protein
LIKVKEENRVSGLNFYLNIFYVSKFEVIEQFGQSMVKVEAKQAQLELKEASQSIN